MARISSSDSNHKGQGDNYRSACQLHGKLFPIVISAPPPQRFWASRKIKWKHPTMSVEVRIIVCVAAVTRLCSTPHDTMYLRTGFEQWCMKHDAACSLSEPMRLLLVGGSRLGLSLHHLTSLHHYMDISIRHPSGEPLTEDETFRGPIWPSCHPCPSAASAASICSHRAMASCALCPCPFGDIQRNRGSIHLSTLSHGYELVSNRMLTFTPRKKLCNETPDKAAAPTLLRVGWWCRKNSCFLFFVLWQRSHDHFWSCW